MSIKIPEHKIEFVKGKIVNTGGFGPIPRAEPDNYIVKHDHGSSSVWGFHEKDRKDAVPPTLYEVPTVSELNQYYKKTIEMLKNDKSETENNFAKTVETIKIEILSAISDQIKKIQDDMHEQIKKLRSDLEMKE